MTNVHLTLVPSILNASECQGYPLSCMHKITYMKQIEYVYMTSMKQIQCDKRTTYIGTIHSKCFRVSRISIILYT